jgi:outer membrane protein assembly factor BamD
MVGPSSVNLQESLTKPWRFRSFLPFVILTGAKQPMKRFFLYFVIGLLLAACSAGQPDPPKTAEFYFQEGESFLEKGLYNEAITSWEKVRDSFYSPELTMLAELKMAETYYLAERYAEAASAYNDFLKQYPGDERKSTTTYWLGMSYYKQKLAIDRDQTNTKNALTVFSDLLRLYPGERDETEIRSLIQQCKGQLAAHEIYVGRFYLKTKKYEASIKRLEEALRLYPSSPQIDEAYFYLLSAYLKLENRAKAEELLQQLSATMPNSPYVAKTEKKLKK